MADGLIGLFLVCCALYAAFKAEQAAAAADRILRKLDEIEMARQGIGLRAADAAPSEKVFSPDDDSERLSQMLEKIRQR